MAVYTDPVTGQRREARLARGQPWGLGLAVLIALAALAWFSYGRMGPTVDHANTGPSTITEPMTTPTPPNTSPTRPPPSP